MELGDKTTRVNTTPKLDNPLSVGVENQIVLNQVINYYHDMLKQTPEALDYLKARGMDNAELIDTFKLGFANRTLGFRLPAKNRIEGNALRVQLQEVGILRSSGHEHFNGSIVVPVLDKDNNVYEVYGRKIRNNLSKGTPKHLYLPGAHTGVFNAVGLRLDMEVILCESLIDALTFWNHGYRNVTCSYGTAGFTDDIMDAFKANNIKRVLIAYDRDKAGNDAAIKLSEKLNKENIDTYRILFPKGMDANEYALNVTPATQSLGIVVRKAEWMGNGLAKERDNQEAPEHGRIQADEPIQPLSLAVKEKSFLPLTAEDKIPEPKAAAQPKQAGDFDELEIDESTHEINIMIGKRTYRIRGMAKNMSYEQLKVNLLVAANHNYYIDTIDLYHAKARASYIKQASIELGIEQDIIKKDLGKILMELELLQEEQINNTLNVDKKPEPTLSEAEYTEAKEKGVGSLVLLCFWIFTNSKPLNSLAAF